MNTNRNVIWIQGKPALPLCDVPWVGTSVVLSDGRVNFCCYSSAVIGNVNHEPFEKIWNGPTITQIRKALADHKLPPECQTNSCPIYRGDQDSYLYERMEGRHSFKATGTHDPHAELRSYLNQSRLVTNAEKLSVGDTLNVELQLDFERDRLFADLFIGVLYPDSVIRFLPGRADYPLPFDVHIELKKAQPIRLEVWRMPISSSTERGEYRICAALFESYSNPNLLSNCYWSDLKTFRIVT